VAGYAQQKMINIDSQSSEYTRKIWKKGQCYTLQNLGHARESEKENLRTKTPNPDWV